MANEFVIKNGFISNGNGGILGNLNVTGNTNISGNTFITSGLTATTISATTYLGLSNLSRQEFTYTTGVQEFILLQTPAAIYNVFVNGQELFSTQYGVSGNVITIIDTLVNGDTISVIYSDIPVNVPPSYTKVETDNLLLGKEDLTNKTTNLTSPDNTKYPTTQAVVEALDLKLTTPTATSGNIIRANGTNYIAINETDFLNPKTPFIRSFLAGMFNMTNIIAYDSFNRPDSSILGNMDSGQTIQKLRGTSGQIINNTCRITNSTDINGIPVTITNTARVKIDIKSDVLTGSLNTSTPAFNTYLYILKDVNNGIIFRATNVFLNIDKVVGGVTTNIASLQYVPNDPTNNRCMQGNSLTLDASLIFATLGADRHARVYLKQNVNTALVAQGNATSLFDSALDNVFPSATDISYIGWGGSNNIIISIDQ